MESEALIVFLDFHKVFDSTEHQFMYRALKSFGFGERFVSRIQMFHRCINSSINSYPNTSESFSICRGVCQGCSISPFYSLL